MSLSILPSPLIFLPSSTPNHTGNFNCLPTSISIVNRISFTYEGHTANVDDGDAATPKLRRVGRAREIAVRLIARLGRPTANTPSYLVCDNGLGTRWQSVHVPRCAHRVNFVRQGAPLVSLVGRGPARRELLRGWLTRCDGKQTTRRLQFSDNGPVDALFSETLEPSLGYWTKRKERLGLLACLLWGLIAKDWSKILL